MHYMISVISDGTEVDDPSVHVAIDDFNERVRQQGYWVYAMGWVSPAEATVVDARGDASVITDGPFIESKEHVAGLWVFDCPNFDVALQLAKEGSKACDRRVEIRPQAIWNG